MAKRDYPNVRIKQKVKPLGVFSIAYDDPRQKKEFKLSAKTNERLIGFLLLKFDAEEVGDPEGAAKYKKAVEALRAKGCFNQIN
jgi:hypothetical protein